MHDTVLKYTSLCSVDLPGNGASRPPLRTGDKAPGRQLLHGQVAVPLELVRCVFTERKHRSPCVDLLEVPGCSVSVLHLLQCCLRLRLCWHVGIRERGYQSGNETGHWACVCSNWSRGFQPTYTQRIWPREGTRLDSDQPATQDYCFVPSEHGSTTLDHWYIYVGSTKKKNKLNWRKQTGDGIISYG